MEHLVYNNPGFKIAVPPNPSRECRLGIFTMEYSTIFHKAPPGRRSFLLRSQVLGAQRKEFPMAMYGQGTHEGRGKPKESRFVPLCSSTTNNHTLTTKYLLLPPQHYPNPSFPSDLTIVSRYPFKTYRFLQSRPRISTHIL